MLHALIVMKNNFENMMLKQACLGGIVSVRRKFCFLHDFVRTGTIE